MTKETRPLSPHLSVYRWQVTNTLSIIHRLSGVILYFGSLLFPLWIAAIAFDGSFSSDNACPYWIILINVSSHWADICVLLSFIKRHKTLTLGYRKRIRTKPSDEIQV